MKTSRRSFLGIAATAIPIQLLNGCGMSQDTNAATVVILIDHSDTIAPQDNELYLQSIQSVSDGLRGGDRILIAQIGNSGRAEFLPVFDHTVLQTNIRLDQEDAVTAAKELVTAAMPGLLRQKNVKGTLHTRILETIAAASQAFRHKTDHRDRIIILSDGIEDSALADFDGSPTDNVASIVEADFPELFKKLQAADLLPPLPGVQLSIIGAGGNNYATVQQFWQQYALRIGATVRDYGRLPYRDSRRPAL